MDAWDVPSFIVEIQNKNCIIIFLTVHAFNQNLKDFINKFEMQLTPEPLSNTSSVVDNIEKQSDAQNLVKQHSNVPSIIQHSGPIHLDQIISAHELLYLKSISLNDLNKTGHTFDAENIEADNV